MNIHIVTGRAGLAAGRQMDARLFYTLINVNINMSMWIFTLSTGGARPGNGRASGRPQAAGQFYSPINVNVNMSMWIFTLSRAGPDSPRAAYRPQANFTLLSMWMLTCQCEYSHCTWAGPPHIDDMNIHIDCVNIHIRGILVIMSPIGLIET